MDNLKDKIVFHVFEFLETDDKTHSGLAKDLLKNMAKKYHVKIKPKKITNTKEAFKDFILNEKGYNITIQKLYNSI